MVFLRLIFALKAIAAVQSELINCDQPVIGKQLCKVNKTMGNKIIELWPDLFSYETPLKHTLQISMRDTNRNIHS